MPCVYKITRQDDLEYIGITVNKKVIEIGSFKKIEDAVKARKDAEAKYGFHPNHGRF